MPTQATETGIQGGRASLRSRSKDVLAEGPTVEVLIQTLAGYAGESAPEGELGRYGNIISSEGKLVSGIGCCTKGCPSGCSDPMNVSA